MKDDKVYLLHILDCLNEIEEFVRDGRDSFKNSRMVRNATLRSLQTLAESATRLSESLKSSNPSIPWRKIHGFRNVIVHDYLGLDFDTIWLVIEVELPLLKTEVKKLLK